MLVPRPIVGKILRGEATLAVRPTTTRRPRVGERLYVKARRQDPVACHVLVEQVEEARLGDVTFEQARAAGYKTTADFRSAWVRAHDERWLDGQDEDDIETTALERFAQHWASKRVHVVTFILDRRERPRLLAQRNAKADYVEHPAQAMPREPEAVPADVQKQFSREGHQGWAAREKQREQDRERLGLEERLRLARAEAREANVDVTRAEASILKRIRALESKVRRRTQ